MLLVAVMGAVAMGQARNAPLEVTVGHARVVEGDAGARSAEVAVVLSDPAPGPVTVAYTTRDGTATAGADYQPSSGTVAFAKGERVKRVAVNVVGDLAIEADESFEVVFSNASGATLVATTGTVIVVNDDFPAGHRLAVYEVRFTFVGHTGSLADAGCPGIRPKGRVVMTGLVAGIEAVQPDDDIEYRGVLHIDADVDLCEATRRNGEDELCVISVVGGGPVTAELSVYADNRGGYIQTGKAPGPFMATATGSCDPQANSDERSAFPGNSKANTFDGMDLAVRSGPLRVGRYANSELVFEVLRVVRHPAPRP